ncbi:hypothetical protein IC580_17930 [Cupriavidus sp. ISTL7]|nr:hypothetical protein IC580_17930 [Cupriavidus sp. ISTL7]
MNAIDTSSFSRSANVMRPVAGAADRYSGCGVPESHDFNTVNMLVLVEWKRGAIFAGIPDAGY